jgi:hypothetical protein
MQDEFLVGSDILVKPVTTENQPFTDIYLPGNQNVRSLFWFMNDDNVIFSFELNRSEFWHFISDEMVWLWNICPSQWRTDSDYSHPIRTHSNLYKRWFDPSITRTTTSLYLSNDRWSLHSLDFVGSKCMLFFVSLSLFSFLQYIYFISSFQFRVLTFLISWAWVWMLFSMLPVEKCS